MGKLAPHSHFTRRSFMLSAAGAAFCAAAAPVLDLIAGPAKASNYRGVVGDIKPRANDSALVDMIKLGPDLAKTYAKYFEDSGIGVVAMEGMNVAFKSISDVPREVITAFVKQKFAEHKGAEAVYILGSGLEALPLIAPLERDLKVPVVQAIAARIWEIERRLKVHAPI